MQKKFKILISAYACSPKRGSEPGMGWNFVTGISKYHEVHVITEKKKWKDEIEGYLELNKELKNSIKFHYIEKRRNKKLRKIWPPSYYWYYKEWQKKAYKLAERLDKKENFDLFHQLNMVGYREPGYLWKFDKPFVWGPIGGMEITPWQFLSSMGLYGFLFFTFRNIINLIQLKTSKRPKKAFKRDKSKIIAATPDTQKKIIQYHNVNSQIISEVGAITYSEINSACKRERNKPLKIIWTGLLIPRKGLNLLIESLKKLNDLNIELHVLGNGIYKKKWIKLAGKMNVSTKIKWHGWIEREEALNVMKNGDLFCITSLHDLTSTVTLEALSNGLPIICTDHCGFAHVVNDECGIKVPVSNPAQLKEDFAKAIEKVYHDEEYRQKLSLGAVNRAKEFSWAKKIEKLNNVYKELLLEQK